MRSGRYIVLGGLLALPFFVIPASGMPFRLSREILALWMGVGLVIVFTPNWWLRGLVGLALVHLIINPASIAYWHMMLLCVFCGVYSVIRKMDDEWMQRLLNGVCLIAAVQAVLIFIQFVGIWKVAGFPRGMLANSGDAGAFLALTLPALIVSKRPLMLAGAVFVFAALMATRSTTAFVSASIGIVLWLMLEKNFKRSIKMINFCLIGVLAIFFFMKVDPIKNSLRHSFRIQAKRTIMAIRDKPWGYGLGSYKELFPAMVADDPRLGQLKKGKDGRYIIHKARQQAHNEYLQMTFELGWPFVLLAAGFLGHGAWRMAHSVKKRRPCHMLSASCALVILAVGCAGFFWLHLADVAFLGVMWLAIWDKSMAHGVKYGGL